MLRELPRRHTLLYLSQAGRACFWQQRESAYPDLDFWEAVWGQLCDIPAITRRQADPGSHIPVGLSLPVQQDGVRCRIASRVPPDEVTRVVTPVRAAELCAGGTLPCSPLVEELLCHAPGYGTAAGIFGSAALAAVTGLSYCHTGSDLDVVLLPQQGADLLALGSLLRRLEGKWGIRIDGEVAVDQTRYVKLTELLSGAHTLLVKGGPTPILCPTCRVLACLASGITSNLKK